MASTFSTGTINQPDAGSVGLAMVEKIRDDLIAHVAWDLVEEFTPGSGLVRWYVFKCLAAQSGMGADFFLVIGRTLGSGELRFFICEEYVAAGHSASYFSMAHVYTNTYIFDSLGRYGGGPYVLSTAVLPNQANTPGGQSWIPSGTSTKYWIIVSEDTLSVAFNGASNGFVHLGAYVPMYALPNPLPIQMLGNLNMPGICRNPAAAGVQTYATAHAFMGGEGSSPPTANVLGFAGYLRYNDKLQANQRAVAEIGMVTYPYQPTEIPAHGWAIGKHKRMRTGLAGSAPAGFAFGDAYVLQGRLWVPYLPTDARVWDTGVAAS